MFSRGSPETAMMSAYFPVWREPRRSDLPRRSAALFVEDWIACIEVMPYLTMNANCLAFIPCGKTPDYVPYEILTPARPAFAKFCRHDAHQPKCVSRQSAGSF